MFSVFLVNEQYFLYITNSWSYMNALMNAAYYLPEIEYEFRLRLHSQQIIE